MIRSFRQLQQIDTGFQASNLLTMNLSLSVTPDEAAKAQNFLDQLGQNLRQLPGAQSAALSSGLPFDSGVEDSFNLEGDDANDPRTAGMALVYLTSPEYLQTMGIRLLRGRYITSQDRAGSTPVVVIDETLARKHFPDQNPIGKRLNGLVIEPAEIIGVVSQVKHYGLDGQVPVDNQVYLPLAQVPPQSLPFVVRRINVLVRTAGDPLGVASAARGEVQALNVNQPVFNVNTMERLVASSITGQRFSLILLALFAGLALVLAAVGIYGVMSSVVEQRTREIGIRVAVGAQRRDVLRLVASQGLGLTGIGVGIGLIGSLALTRVMATLLSGVSTTDPLTFAGVASLLIAVAALACYVPARRAMKVDPLQALRHE